MYLDTSVLVTALTSEQATLQVQDWFNQRRNELFCISDWVITEFASALSGKLRSGHMSPQARAASANLFAQMIEESLTVVPVGRSHFQAASRYVERHDLGLRAADALHLAIAAGRHEVIATRDKHLAEAALTLGVLAELV